MKKIILLFFFFCLSLILSTKTEIPVFEELSNLDSSIVCIAPKKITSKNFVRNFENIKIFEISPYINPLYKNQTFELESYKIYETIKDKTMEEFTKYYLSILKEKGYGNDYYKYSFYGISIEKILLEKEELNKINRHIVEYETC